MNPIYNFVSSEKKGTNFHCHKVSYNISQWVVGISKEIRKLQVSTFSKYDWSVQDCSVHTPFIVHVSTLVSCVANEPMCLIGKHLRAKKRADVARICTQGMPIRSSLHVRKRVILP